MDVETFKTTLGQKHWPFLDSKEKDAIVSMAETLISEVRQQVVNALQDDRERLQAIGMLPKHEGNTHSAK